MYCGELSRKERHETLHWKRLPFNLIQARTDHGEKRKACWVFVGNLKKGDNLDVGIEARALK